MRLNKSQRKLAFIIAIVTAFLIVSIGVIYYFTSPSSEWRTYSGKIFGGYAVQYPSGWVIEEKGSKRSFEYVLISRKIKEDVLQGDYEVTIIRLHKTLGNLESCARKRGDDNSLEKTKVAGLDALKGYTPSVSNRPAVTNYYFTWEGYDYVIGVLNQGKSDSVGTKILKTLQFNS